MLKFARWAIVSLLVVSILVLVFAVGYVVRGDSNSTSLTPNPSKTASADQSATNTDFTNLEQIYALLRSKYVDQDLVDRSTLYQAAINGMLKTFPDSGTFYVDPNTVKTSVGPTGVFDGIGATVASQNGQIVIVAPIAGSPAERAGIKAGDAILDVDGESTQGWTEEKAVIKIRGPRGTSVKLKVRHTSGDEATFDISRDEIKVQSVTTLPPTGTLKDGSGAEITDLAYIQIREFSETTKDEMHQALQDAVSSGKEGVIIDLRNNPGGLLQTTVDIADEFLDGNKTILTEKDRDGSEHNFASHAGGVALAIPVVIIMNRFSASGSEVLAAALHDNQRATIVGEKSFGKGTVNISNPLKDGGQLYVSIAKWLTPNGTQIDGVGIRPDIEVALSNEDIDAHRDGQLLKAIDVLRSTNFAPVSTPAAIAPTPTATPTRVGG